MNFSVVLFVLTIFASSSIFFVHGQAPVDNTCLGCLCYVMTNCTLSQQCSRDICGPYSITWAYWADAGKPTLAGESPETPASYSRCANDINCASLTVQSYMNKFGRDCNGDGVTNCDDYVRIHRLGPYGCTGNLDEKFSHDYYLCKQSLGIL